MLRFRSKARLAASFAVALLVTACSAPDPNALPSEGDDPTVAAASRDAGAPRTSPSGDPSPDETPGSGSPPVVDASATDAAANGDAHAATDGATSDGAAPAGGDLFADAGAYVAKLGPTTRKGGHNFAGNTPKTNPAGQPCLGCHSGAGGPEGFGAAGTVYTSAAATTPAARVEVRVRDKNGKALSAFTDADGNFFIPLNPNGDFAFPGSTAARDGTTAHAMTTAIPSGNCNSCHSTAGGQARIYLP